MDRDHIPDEVKRFVLASIPSVPFLEALLQLRNEGACGRDKVWLAKKIYVSEEAAGALLGKLYADGFVKIVENGEETYRYHPMSEGLRQIVNKVARAYSRHLVEISQLIHSKKDDPIIKLI